MARNPKVELRGHEGQVVHPITDGDCVIFPSGETLSHKLSEQEEVMYAPEVTNSSPMFKVGEGDSSDYSANVLDGAYQEAVLKGQTYVNTIQEPSADVITLPTPFTEYERTQSKTFTEMQDGTFGLNLVGQSYVNCIQEPSEPSYVALGENLEFQNKKVEYTTDGQIKSAMLNGQTLVNLINPKSISPNTKITTNTGYIIEGNDTAGSNIYTNLAFNLKFSKPNTNYFVKWESATGNLNDGFARAFEYTTNKALSNNLSLPYSSNNNYTSGNYFVFNSGDISDNNNLQIRFHLNGTSTSTTENCTLRLVGLIVCEYQEGMENWDIPYFEGVQSVTMSTELENVCSRYNSSAAKNGKTFTVGTWENRTLHLSTVDNIAKYNFKPNTKYLVQFKVTNLNLDGLDSITLIFSDSTIASGNSLFGEISDLPIAKNGIYRTVLTTTNVVSTSSFVIKGTKFEWEDTTSTSRTLTISQIMCIEYQNGMENWDLPYFETTQLMKPVKVKSNNKNLVDLSSCIYAQNKNNVETSYIKIKPNTTYIASMNNKYGSTVTFYTKDKEVIQTTNGFTASCISSNAYYLRWVISTQDTTADWNSFQIEESLTETPYTPHQSKTISALEPITLRAIGNVKDTLDLSTGEYVQRIGEIVLDGSDDENYGKSQYSTDNYGCFYIEVRDSMPQDNTNKYSLPFEVKCDKLPYKQDVGGYVCDYEGINNIFEGIRINILASKLSENTIDGFKAYLQQNPIKVQYQLANPITRKISLEYPNLQTYTDITHVQSIAMDGTLIPNIYLPSDISYKAMLKPNTSYNVIVDREVIDSTNQLTVNLGGTTANITANRTVVTTPSTLSNETLTFSGKDNRIAKAMLIEGGTLINGDLPHFDGIGDVKLGRVVENLCMANHTTVGGATSTGTLYSDKITSKITKTGSHVHIFQLTKNLENSKRYFIYCPYDYQYIIYGFKHEYNNSLSYSYQSCEGVNKKYAIIQIDGNQQKNPYTHFTVGCHGNIPVNTTMTIRRPILCEYIDGMENWDWESIGYFTGIRNIGNEFMRIGNKNLFSLNKDSFVQGRRIKEDNLQVSSAGTRITSKDTKSFKCKPNTSYTITLSDNNYDLGIYTVDDNETFLQDSGWFSQRSNKTFTTDKKARYFVFNCRKTDDTNITLNDYNYSSIQLEEASSATSYVAHKHNSLHILPNEQIPLTFEQGAIIFSTTTSFAEQINNTMTTRIRTGLLDLEPNETYRISFGDKNYICGIAFYDNSNIGLNAVNGISNDYVFTTTKNVHKFCINIARSDWNLNIEPSVLHQVRLEKVTDVTLRSVGDVKDELDLTRGVYIQRMYEVKLNGFEDWSIHNEYSTDNHLCFYWGYKKIPSYDHNKFGQWYCAINVTPLLIPRGWNSFYGAKTDEEGVTFNGDNKQNIVIKIRKDRLSSQDVNGFKQWLQSNPITVQYPLATPIEHKINIPMKNELNQTIAKPNGIFTLPLMYSETNHVDINSQIYPKVQSRDYISYPVIANNSQLHTVFHNKLGTGNLTVNLCGTSVTSVDGTSKCTVTTPSTISQYELRLSGARNKVSNVCVFSGDYMNVDVPYVQGMMNAVNPIVKNVGKNLFDYDNYPLTYDGEYYMGTCRNLMSYNTPCYGKTVVISGKGYTDGTAKQPRLHIYYTDGTNEVVKYISSTDRNNPTEFRKITLKPVNYISIRYHTNGVVYLKDVYVGIENTNYEPYKENICYVDCGEIRLTPDMFEQGSFNELSSVKNYYETKTASTHALQLKRIRLIDPIPVKPNTKYIVKINRLEDYDIFVAYFKNNERVGFEGYWKNKEFTTPSDCNQIVFVLKRKGDAQILVGDIDYNKLIFSKVDKTITLRSLPNGVRDELNLETGEYIQRIGEVVLDGSADENIISMENNYNIALPEVIPNAKLTRDIKCISCDKLPIIYWEDSWDTKISAISPHDNGGRIYIRNTAYNPKEWLSQNPLTIQYQLATPIIKQVDINNFPHSYKDGHVIIENNDPSTNVTAQMTYQCVANRTGQIQEHTEQVEKQEHEINELEMLILENIRQQQNR